MEPQAGPCSSDFHAQLRKRVRKLFDVAVLQGVRNPVAIGFVSDELQRVISIEEDGV